MDESVQKLLARVPAMKARFEAARPRYDALLRVAQTSIARFEWCASPRYSHYPFGVERFGWKRGRAMTSEPKKKNGKHRYGLTADDLVLLDEQYVEFEGQRYETFWEHLSDRIDATQFSYWREKPVINVESSFYAEGLPTGFIRYAERGLFVESYEYADGFLVRAHQAAREHDPKSRGHELTATTDMFEYAGEQLARVVRIWSSGDSEVIFP